MSQYTPKKGEAERLDREKLQRIADENKPLNKFARSKASGNLQDAIEAALIMEGGLAAGKIVGKGAKAAGKYLTEETALKNAYKLNPLAFKPKADAYYRMIGEGGYADALESGVVRPPKELGQEYAYYNKGYPLDTRFRNATGRAGYEGPYMAEVKGNSELFVNENTKGFTGPMFDDPVVYSKAPISTSNPDINLYKEDWLRAYKKVPKTIGEDATSLGQFLTQRTPLKNAYKLNPYAFKPQEGMMYRGIGKEGMEDALQSGMFRAKQDVTPTSIGNFNTTRQFSKAYYSPRFDIADQYGQGFIAEVPRGASDWGKRYGKKEWSQIAQRDIPITEGKVLQKDWLKRYKEVSKKEDGGWLNKYK
jgi:hypothetical protein